MKQRPRNRIYAFVLSVMAPGLGQIYNGQPRKALLFAVASIVLGFGALAFVNTRVFLPALVVGVGTGLAVWVWTIVDAYLSAQRQQEYEIRAYNRVWIYVLTVLVVRLGSDFIGSYIKDHYAQAYRMPSMSMSPALLPGDYIFVDKRGAARNPKTGDIIAFEFPPDPTKIYVKRVIAGAGQKVEVRNKALLIDDASREEPFAVHMDQNVRPAGYDSRDNFGPVVIPTDHLFVLGDNRDNSNDSRYWGPLETRLVQGRAHGIYFSWDVGKKRIRWERIGRLVN